MGVAAAVAAPTRVRGVALGGAVFAGAAVSVGGLSAANGGFFSSSWGWPALGFAWAVALALVLHRSLALGRLELAALAGWCGLAGWYLASVLWSSTVPGSVYEAERALVYATGAAAILLVVRRRELPALVGGTLAGIVAVDLYALGTRLLPDRLGSYDPAATYRLSTPVGYWNGLGILSVIGLLLALGLAARAERLAARALAAAAVPVLAATLYFTFSRGALIALAIALLAAVALDAARLQLVTVALLVAGPTAIGVWRASRSHALTTQGSALAAASHQGHRLALLLVLLAVVSAALVALHALGQRRVSVPRAFRLGYGALLAAIAIACVAVALEHWGGPATAARTAWHSFTAPPAATNGQLNKRLFNLSNNGRIDLWKAAWHEAQAHPLLGGGAGSYEQWWAVHRRETQSVLDAHSLYLETLAELGSVGLALLALALLAPIAAAVRARRRALVAPLFGAYVAYVVHAAADWDWELAGVTLAAVAVGAALLASARVAEPERETTWRVRGPALAATAVVAAAAFVILVGNLELGQASSAALARDWGRSAAKARAAERWQPWSSEPWRLLGEAQMLENRNAEARRSFRTAIAKDPRQWVLWLDLAAASSGRESAAALARAARLNPLSDEVASFRSGP